MSPENNSNPNQNPQPIDSNSFASSASVDQFSSPPVPSFDSTSSSPIHDIATSDPLASEPTNDAPAAPLPSTQFSPTSPDSSGPRPPAITSGGHKKSPIKAIFLALVILLLLGAVGYGAFTYGKSQAKTETKTVIATPTAKEISLPPQAVVTAECVPGRGKQYIIPKDIPQGPIFDVHNNKVIAIEYVMGIKSLFTNSDSFSTAILSLAKNYPVDHFALVPGVPKRGDTDQYIHLIMFVVPKKEAESIKCSNSPTVNRNSTSMPSSSSSTTSPSTSTTPSTGTSTSNTNPTN